MFYIFLTTSLVMAVVSAVAAWAHFSGPSPEEKPVRPLTREERVQNMLLVADEHEKRSFEASISIRPTQRKYHYNRAEALRKEAAELLDPPPLCPEASTRNDYR